MRTPVLPLAALCALLAFEPGCNTQSSLLKDTIALDQAMIPVLAMTAREVDTVLLPADRAELLGLTKAAMMLLTVRWARFRDKYAGSRPADRLWSTDFAKADQLVADANEIVSSGELLMRAHDRLQTADATLREARRRNGIEYFPDYLTDFHKSIDSAEATLERLPRVGEELLKGPKSTWQRIETVQFDPKLFGFESPKTAELDSGIKVGTDALATFGQALAGTDTARIKASWAQVKANVGRMYRLFGDFQRVKSS